MSWSKVSSGAPAFRAYPSGFIYDVAGTSIFATTSLDRLRLLSFVNSQVAFEQLTALAPTLNFEVGQVATLSVAVSSAEVGVSLAARAVEVAMCDWDSFDSSWGFVSNPLVELARR